MQLMSRRLVALLLITFVSLPSRGSNLQDDKQCRESSSDERANYDLANALIITHLSLLGGRADSLQTLDDAQLKTLNEFTTGIAGLVRTMAGEAFVRKLLMINGIPLPQVLNRDYSVYVINDSRPEAWGCVAGSERKYRLRLTTGLLYAAAQTAIRNALQMANHPQPDDMDNEPLSILQNDEDLQTPKQFSEAVSSFSAGGKNTGPAGDSMEAGTLRSDVRAVETLATTEYVKLLTFVIGHESSHMWVDNCAASTSELRADDFGFVLSSLLFDEQMLHAFIFNLESVTDVGMVQAFTAYQKVASAKTKEPVEDKDLLACYQHWSKMSNVELIGMAHKLSRAEAPVMKEASINLRSMLLQAPMTKRGYELFASVYETWGTQEYLGSSGRHPAIGIRKARLTSAYAKESFIVAKVYSQLIQHKVQVTAAEADTATASLKRFFSTPNQPGVCSVQTPKRPNDNRRDPCLSPPPKPQDFADSGSIL